MTGPGGAARGAAPGLAVERVTVRFGPTTALADVSLDVAPGEVVALLGPSGCGKSTLLRAVAGLQPIDAGSIRWAGADLTGVPVHRRGFGLMFQDGQLFAHRTVAGNVAFGLQMAGLPKAARRDRVTELLDLVGLAGYGARPVGTLSGGEQQRVALARSLAPHPRLLLLDEPLSALDRALRERLTGDLAAILRRAGTTSLYVTHDQDEAFAVADRVAVLAAGRLLQVDSPARLWAAPASRTVAEFLGYEAFLPLPADDGAAPALLALAPGSLRISGPASGSAGPEVGTGTGTGSGPGPAPEAAGPGEGAFPAEGRSAVVVAQRARRGGTEVDVRLPGGEFATAMDEADSRRRPGERVLVRLVGPAVVIRPPAAGSDEPAAHGARGGDR